MKSIEEARSTILARVERLETETVPVLEALGRVLDEDILSETDIPPFDGSTMDGYAVRSEDTSRAWPGGPAELKVVGGAPAGSIPESPINEREAIRIMTGAPMPQGADAVVMLEQIEQTGDGVLIFAPARPGENVRFAGEEIKKGDIALARGKKITAGDIGTLASAGKARVDVVRKPVVAIIPTGDELVDIDQPLGPGKIKNSNAYAIAAQVIDAGCVPLMLGIAPDNLDALTEKVLKGVDEADMVVTTGGVSAGDYDFVKDMMEAAGELVFWQVEMKPGAPLAFGVIGGKPVVGLPGNPAASMVDFEQFARPALLKMSGRSDIERMIIDAVFQESFVNSSGHRNMLRVLVAKEDGVFTARLTGRRKPGGRERVAQPNGLMTLEADMELKPGDRVTVQLFEPVTG